MSKITMTIGHKYLHHRKIDLDGRPLEAERWIKCIGLTKNGALFQHEFEVFELESERLKTEIIQEFRGF
uniref:hypothetical protein n=1 Tax=Lachnoclostridium phocaeense TaxID=1871021 RepID=UPI0026DA9757|nr:hypothetical protein [Lachnoclostridium phocaeense]